MIDLTDVIDLTACHMFVGGWVIKHADWRYTGEESFNPTPDIDQAIMYKDGVTRPPLNIEGHFWVMVLREAYWRNYRVVLSETVEVE